jgi:hypothetical protein
MKPKISVKGIEKEMERVRSQIRQQGQVKVLPVSIALKDALTEATPVDTGTARDGWKVEIQGGSVAITNNVPYIDDLNKGHSQQAPAFFIEKTILENKDVVPDGTIVSYR